MAKQELLEGSEQCGYKLAIVVHLAITTHEPASRILGVGLCPRGGLVEVSRIQYA